MQRLIPPCLVVLLGFAGSALTAQSLPLPLSQPIDSGTVEIRATFADITIEIDPRATPFLEASAFSADGPAPGQLDMQRVDGVQTWTRPAIPAEGERPVYEIRVVVGRGQAVRIRGVDLNVRVRDLEPQEGKASPTLDLDVEASDIELVSVRSALIQGRSTFVRVHDGRGNYELTLSACRLEIDGHRGEATLEAEGGESVLQHLHGRLTLALTDHRLDLLTADIKGGGKATGGSMAFEDWQGQLNLDVENLTFDASTARAARSQLTLTGKSAQVSANGLEGTTFVTLQGGSFIGRNLAGSTQAVIRDQGTTELASVDGVVKVHLTEGASARLSDLTGRVRLSTTDSQAEAERIYSLKVEGIRSEITVLEVQRQEAVTLTDSELELDMSNAEDASAFILRGDSEARVRVPSPCLVRVHSSPEVEPEQVQIGGCQVPSPEEARAAPVRGTETMVLTASLRDASQLRIDGVER